MRQFGDTLREARKKAKLSQSEVARRADVSSSFICDLESGKRTALLKTLQKIARAMGYRIVISIDPKPGESNAH